ncbi:MAG: hypothetical protein ACO1OC_09845 [Tuberibacillus sp.]
MKKRALGMTLITTLIIALIVWIVSLIFSFSYTEYGYVIGLILTIVLLLFNTSGGAPLASFEASESVGKLQKNEEIKMNVGIVFYGSALYTIIGLIIMILV